MKLLLDENLPHQFRFEIPGHDCFTVAYMKWSGVKNGKLLALAAADGFDALLTKDANLQYQQDLANLPIAVIVMHSASNDTEDQIPLVPAILQVLSGALAPIVYHVGE